MESLFFSLYATWCQLYIINNNVQYVFPYKTSDGFFISPYTVIILVPLDTAGNHPVRGKPITYCSRRIVNTRYSFSLWEVGRIKQFYESQGISWFNLVLIVSRTWTLMCINTIYYFLLVSEDNFLDLAMKPFTLIQWLCCTLYYILSYMLCCFILFDNYHLQYVLICAI